MLTHYTPSLKAINGILSHGFAWVPNQRRLVKELLPEHDFAGREPQQFGMVSFTELIPEHAVIHRQNFGQYGIVISDEWAARNKAQRVIYIENDGPVTEALRTAYRIGYNDLVAKIKHPDDGAWQMAYHNKAMAGAVVGAGLWATLLTIWEYLEPATCAAQREWRVVNPEPDYSIRGNRTELIAKVSPPLNWAKFANLLRFGPADVTALVCPLSERDAFLTALPETYARHDILYTQSSCTVAP